MNRESLKPQSFSTPVWNNRVTVAWENHFKPCPSFQGNDGTLHGLCNHNDNKGSVKQEGGCLRCNIFNCPTSMHVYSAAGKEDLAPKTAGMIVKQFRNNAEIIPLESRRQMTNSLD